MRLSRLFMILFVVGCSGDATLERANTRLGQELDLPEPISLEEASIYPTGQERTPEAKADGLAVTSAHQDVFGVTGAPGRGVELLAEWAPANAVLIAWHPPLSSYFEALVDVLVGSSVVWIITQNEVESQEIGIRLETMGIGEGRVRFFEYEHEAFWTRDYGPWSVRTESGEVGFVDPRYYPTRYRDDAVPTLLGERIGTPIYRPKFSAEGGNLMSNGSGLCVTTTRLNYNNPPLKTYEMHDVLSEWVGCRQTVFLEPLKGERTGHVDLIAKFTQVDTVLLGSYRVSDDADNAARLDRNAQRLSEVRLSDGRPLRILRVPMPPNDSNYFPTYTNSLLVNGTLIMPSFGEHPELEVRAVEVYREALPQDTVVELVDASDVIEFGGAVHCTTMQLSFGVVDATTVTANQPGALHVPDDTFVQQVNLEIEDLGTLIVNQEIGGSGIEALEQLEVVVNVEHRVPESLQMTLVRGGQRVDLGMPDDVSPLNRFRVTLPDFIGQPMDGMWTLEIEDTSAGFRGALLSWWLRSSE